MRGPFNGNRGVLARVMRAIQGNFDHFDNIIRDIMRKHNQLDDNVQDLTEFVNDNLETIAHDNTDAIAAVAAAAITDHGALSGLADDDHPQYATDTDLSNHLTDSADAHDASAISIVDSGNYFSGTEVEAALQELGAGGGGGSDGSDHDILDHADADGGDTPAPGDVLTWTGSLWDAESPAAGGATDLPGLSDVNNAVDSGSSGGEVLTWNDGAGEWQASMPNTQLSGLADVTVTEGPGIDGDVLAWNDGLSTWEAVPPPADGAPGGGVTFVFASRVHPVTGIGRRAYLDRDVTIDHVYAWSTDTAPTGTFECDVLLNDVSIFTGTGPTITSGNYLGSPVVPTTTAGSEYDKLEVEFVNIGGTEGRIFVAVVCHV